ncbi:MAG: hypothetical protein HFJ02_05375 [Bacilli bacterium]|nr:hypothetical protein [Bacilli bacterium]
MSSIKPIKINHSASYGTTIKNGTWKASSVSNLSSGSSIKNYTGIPSYDQKETEVFTLPSVERAFLDLFNGVLFTLNGIPQYSLGLNSPTQIVKYDDLYFIVNTFSNRILFSKDMVHWNLIEAPNGESFNLAHSVAFDGKNLVITDTDNKRMLSYVYDEENFIYSGSFDDNGLKTRFHYVTYDKETAIYYAIGSEFGDVTRTYEFKIQEGQFISTSGEVLVGKEIKTRNGNHYVNENQSYVRSFTIENDSILMPIHNLDKSSEILIMDKHFNVQKTVSVPDFIGGVTCIKKVNDYYVLTSSTDREGHLSSNIAVAKTIEDFANGKFNVVDDSIYKGLENYIGNVEPIPYFIENFNDVDWLTINNSKTPICAINIDEYGKVELLDSHIK